MTNIDQQVPSTWNNRDLPILRAALQRSDAGDTFPSLELIRNDIGLDVLQMRIGLAALEGASPPYLTYKLMAAGSGVTHGFVESVSERARRELGSWPTSSSIVESLVAALDAKAASEPDATKKSLLRTAAETLSGIAHDVAVAVITAKVGTL
jgi:hypothetical protein